MRTQLDDCPMCLSAGSVREERCQICDAWLVVPSFAPGSDIPNRVVDLPPAAPSGPARPSDLLEELEAIAEMVAVPQGALGLATACLRAATIMMTLRAHLLEDIENGVEVDAGPIGPLHHRLGIHPHHLRS